MPNWIVTVLVLAPLVIAIGVLLWLINEAGDLYFEHMLRKRFRRDLHGAIEHTQPAWTLAVEMARSRGLDQHGAYVVARALLRDVLSGSEKSLLPQRPLLESYISTYRQSEPYDGIPASTRVPLERVRDALGNKRDVIEPLVAQIRELALSHHQEKTRQRFYTVGGFILGIIGLLFAAYSHFAK